MDGLKDFLRDQTRDSVCEILQGMGINAQMAERGQPEENIELLPIYKSLGVINISEGPIRWLFKLKEDEEFVARTFDESGSQFFLLFNKTHSHFMWVLNEENGAPAVLIPLQNNIVYDRLSGFAFYVSETDDY